MKNRTVRASVVVLALVLTIVLSPSARAQSFSKVIVQGKAKMKQISSGGASVWGLGTNGHAYVFKTTKFLQVSTISLTQIAVGGGNQRQPDTVWALDSTGGIYNVVKSGTTYVFNQMPGILDFIAVGIGYQDSCHPYEVWGLNPSAQIYRFDFCLNNWDQIAGTLETIAVSGGDVWGMNGDGTVFSFDYTTQSFQSIYHGTYLAAAPQSVWVFNHDVPSDYVHQFTPSGGTAVSVILSLTQIQAGGDGVWGINSSGQVFALRYAATEFVQIPGILLASISVGSGGGVWGIDSTGQVFAFSTQ